MKKNVITNTKKIILTSLFLAVFIILDRLLTINTQIISINFSLVSVMLVAMILGPKYAIIVGALGDLIGAVLMPFGPYFPGFTFSSGLAGLIFGIFLYKNPNKQKKGFILKSIISNLLVLIIVNIVLNSLWLNILYKKAFIYYFSVRISTQLILFPIYSILIITLERELNSLIKKYVYEEENMNYLEYFDTFFKFTKDPNLNAMKWLMNQFGNPQDNLKIIHIAGTNGKGSICELLNNVLVKQGYIVGKFLSPHLIKYNERMCINNKEITDEEMMEILLPLSEKIEEYNKNNESKITQFEMITSLAFIYFEKKKCDFVVLETGLGGTLDCTNIVNSMVSIIANIGYDHMDILGDTIEEITNQKAGIIKKNSDVVICNQPETIEILTKVAQERNTKMHIVSKECIKNYKYNENLQTFDYKEYKKIQVNLKGKAQPNNVAEVLECIDILKNKGFKIEDKAIYNGLKTVIHKGRLEQLNKKPLIVFDGGHNENAILNLKDSIQTYYSKYKKVYIVSILKTKDYKKIISELCQNDSSLFIFTSGNDKSRYVSKGILYREAKKCGSKTIMKKELLKAIKICNKQYNKCAILVIGSFYVYKDVVECIKELKIK